MVLKANKAVGNSAAQREEVNPEVNGNEGDDTPQTPAVRTSSAPAVAKGNGNAALQNLNADILEGIDDLGGGNFVSVDGTNFLYKSANEEVDHIDIMVHYGKRFYQWVDESGENKVFHNSDTKLDDRYKLKFELRWNEERNEGELVEFTISLSTTSALNFIDYIKKLATAGYGIGHVATRMTISRQESRDKKNRFSRVEFEAFDLETGQSLGVKTPQAKTIA